MYWSTDKLLATYIFNQTMSRNRFQVIYSNFHFNDSETDPRTDRLYKIRLVLDYLLFKFRDLFEPDKTIMAWPFAFQGDGVVCAKQANKIWHTVLFIV